MNEWVEESIKYRKTTKITKKYKNIWRYDEKTNHDLGYKDNHENILPKIIHKFNSTLMKIPKGLNNWQKYSDVRLK